MPFYTDQLHRTIEICTSPKKIISIVPSQTELLFDLGLNEQVAGITKFCVHPPEWFRNKTRIGGTKQLNLKLIRKLQPDLIIANKEENVKEQVEELAREFPVWVSDVHDLPSALEMIEQVGRITGTDLKAIELINKIDENFALFKPTAHTYKPRTLYLIWKDPYMTVGGDTFIHQMMQYAGLENVYANEKRYPVVNLKELLNLNCELVLLSSEPYPFRQKHIEELRSSLPLSIKFRLVDGEMFSWFGSRLVYAPEYFKNMGPLPTSPNRGGHQHTEG